MSTGWLIYYVICAMIGAAIGIVGPYRLFIRFKWWLLWKLEPWYEERASLDLAWRVFAQKHNTAGKRPICAYDGWEKELDPLEKIEFYDMYETKPDYLTKKRARQEKIVTKAGKTGVS